MLELLDAQPGDLSVVLATDDPSGQFLGSFYNGVLNQLGQRTAPVVFYPPGTTDFTPFLTRLKGLNPDWMHNWYIAADSVLIAEQALNWKSPAATWSSASTRAGGRRTSPAASTVMCRWS